MPGTATTTPAVGQPLCPDCYDYPSHVVWQWWAPDLWRRFTITLRRLVAKTLGVPEPACGEVATRPVRQGRRVPTPRRHPLPRPGPPRRPPHTATASLPPRRVSTPDCWPTWLVQAAASVRLTVPGVDERRPARILAFGQQVDARPVRHQPPHRRPDRALEPGAGRRLPGQVRHQVRRRHRRRRQRPRPADPRPPCRDLDRPELTAPRSAERYVLIGKWVHMLGFRGHFASKSRRYSITLGALRRARRRASLIAEARAKGETLDLAALEADLLADDDDETTLVIGHWHYVGTGWNTDGEQPSPSPPPHAPANTPSRAAEQKQTHRTRERKRIMVLYARIEDRLWSVQDVSEYLGIPVQTLYAWRSAATGPPGRLGRPPAPIPAPRRP